MCVCEIYGGGLGAECCVKNLWDVFTQVLLTTLNTETLPYFQCHLCAYLSKQVSALFEWLHTEEIRFWWCYLGKTLSEAVSRGFPPESVNFASPLCYTLALMAAEGG